MQPRGTLSGVFARSWSAVAAAVSARGVELAAAAAAVALYVPSIGYGFVFDDLALIGPDGAPVALGGAIPYRPLRFASYALDASLGGSPAVYHLHNVLLHGLTSAFVVALARRLGALPWIACAAGLLVAAHPLAVEAAAYVSGRRDLLCVALGLAALHAQLSGRLAASLALLVAATAAKESALVFAAPLVAASLARLGPSPSRAAMPLAARRGIGAIVLGAASALALALAYGAVGPWLPSANVAAWAMPGHVILHYAGSVAGAHALAPEYPSLVHAASRLAGGDAVALATGLATGAVVAAATLAAFVACARGAGKPAAASAFAAAWATSALGALAVWGGLHEPGADRHAYLLLPALGVALALAASARARPGSLRNGAFAAAAAAVIVLAAGATRAQMTVWKDERSLWSHALAHAPSSPRAHANLARVRAADGDWSAAARHLRAAAGAAPDDPLLLLSRAAVRCARARPHLVRRDLGRALALGADASRVRGVAADCGVRLPLRRRAGASS